MGTCSVLNCSYSSALFTTDFDICNKRAIILDGSIVDHLAEPDPNLAGIRLQKTEGGIR